MTIIRQTLLALTLVPLLGVGPAVAHDPGLSSLMVRVDGAALDVTLRVNRADLLEATQAQPADAVAVTLDGRQVDATLVEVADEPSHAVIHARYPVRGTGLQVRSAWLERLPFGHRQFARVESVTGNVIAERVLSAGTPTITAAITPGETSDALGAFFSLGVEHILAGWDHLVFLLTLLVACSRLPAVLRTVTAFTAAHSLTLAAATLGWTRLPASLVEPAIAGSIVAAALLNVVGPAAERRRLAVTFGFGLIHGLGFAGALADLGLGSSVVSVVRSLLAFNVGVETGQLVVVAGALPLLWTVRRSPAYARYGVPACSTLAAAIGVAWLLERTVM